jgi:PKD repeat protein
MKQFFLLFFIGSTSFLFGQAPDGFPSTFTSNGNGNWNGGIWTLVSGSDLDGPDGDDYVIIAGNDVTVAANAGFGHLEYSAAGPSQPTFTINSGISLTGYDTDEDGAITLTANGAAFGEKTLTLNIDGGTASCTSLLISTTKANGNALLNIKNGGILTVENDLTVSSFGDDTDVQLDATVGAGNTLNLGGAITGISTSGGVINMGSSAGVSTFNFNGSSAQTIQFDDPSDLIYSDIQISNSSAVAIGSALSSANVTGNLTISAGGVFDDGGFANSFTGNIANAGTYNGAGAINLTGNLTISVGGVVNDGGDGNVFNGDVTNAGTYNAISGSFDVSGDFTNSGIFNSSGCNINLEGNWDNTGGTYTPATGDNFTFDGAVISTITGATDWYELTADNPGGVTVSSGAQSIHGILDLDQGTFTSGGLVTLISDATSTGQMDNTDGAIFSGDLTVQRRVAKTAQSFISIGSPVSGTTLASYSDDNIIYTGDGVGTFTGADYETFGWHNTYWYDEGAADGVMNNGFTKATTTTQAVGVSNSYKAFHIYTDAVTYNLDVTGVPNTGIVNVPLNYDGGFAANQAGWNLIANPYPCTIDWESIHGGGLGTLIDGYFVYNDGLSNYDYYDGGANTGLVAATQFIPHTQGFWVRSIGLTTLVITEADKNTTDQAFYKSSSTNVMRIGLAGGVNTFGDAAVLIEGSNYTANYDADLDVQKFTTLDPDNAPSLYMVTPDGYDVCFNKIPSVSVSIPLVAKAGTIAQGDYTLSFDIPTDFMLGGCITLEDLHTGMITDLRSDTSYSYVTSDTTTLPRFIIHIVKDFNTNVVDLTCFGTTDGLVNIDGLGITGSIFELLDGAGNVVFSGAAANDAVEFTNVPAGEYEVATNHVGSCSAGNLFISVIEPAQVIANFELVEDTVYLNQGGMLAINNMSSATNYTWDFGDGNTSIDENPTHVYSAPGVYQVMLTSDNDNVGQCTEVTSRNVVVMNGPLAIYDMQLEENSNAFVNNGKVVVDFDLENNSNVEITLVDVTGKIIISNEHTIFSGRIALINTDEVSKGVYFVNITIEGQRKSQKLFID